MNSTDDGKEAAASAQLDEIVTVIRELSPAWTKDKVASRLAKIQRFVLSNTDDGIPIARRRKIARCARDLLAMLEGVGGLDSAFLSTLAQLSAGVPQRSKKERRSEQHSVKDSVRRMAVRLYIEATADPGFSSGGPLVRFANAVLKLTLDKEKPFTDDSIKGEFGEMKPKVPKPAYSPGALYPGEPEVVERKIQNTT